jgi:beta-phosphoglucomutase-like phosphatase (HAD superfamily)
MTMPSPWFLFDLDGTLVDSVHVLAWREALQEPGIELSVWRIPRISCDISTRSASGPDDEPSHDPTLARQPAGMTRPQPLRNRGSLTLR